MARSIIWLVGCLALAVAPGCSHLFGGGGATGKLAIRSYGGAGSKTSISGAFDTSLYSMDGPAQATIVLISGPIEKPIAAVTLRMMWVPATGKTAISPDATNVVIRYVIFEGENGREVGVYSGAGFLYPPDDPGGRNFSGSVWQAYAQLSDRSPGFLDKLGQSNITGSFTAKRDTLATREALRKINALVNERLGYPMLLWNDQEPAAVASTR